MKNGELQNRLRALTKDHRYWVRLGVVDSIEAHPDLGELLNIHLVPDSDTEIQARPLRLGTGSGQSATNGISVEDEVLVFFPNGDPNEAIAVGGLESSAAPLSPMESLLKADTFITDLTSALSDIVTGLASVPYTATQVTNFITKLTTDPSPYKTTALESE